MPGQVYEDGKVHVRSEPCDHCLLSRDRLVSGERARQLVSSTRATEGGAFICHRGQVSAEHTAICRAWWDRFADEDAVLRLAKGMGIVVEVHPSV